MIDRHAITGLVLAGGRGSRMGGLDKGLQLHRGQPLARHALARLAPQVGTLALNANRHLGVYAAMDVPVWPDALPDHPGPLAGLLVGLTQVDTPFLVTVPCDAPLFPTDLVVRLAMALVDAGADLAIPTTREPDGRLQRQPVFCLLRRELRDHLAHALAAGERRIESWTAQHRRVEVLFDDCAAFANANTLADLAALQQHG